LKAHIIKSVDMYSESFLKFAPHVFRTVRVQTTKDVEPGLEDIT